MKRLSVFTLLLILFLVLQGFAQVFTGDITITSQAEVDAFAYSEVTGNISIVAVGDLTNLDGLSSLTTVGKSLYVELNVTLTNIDGLSSLTSIGMGLSLMGNSALTSVDGLSSLTTIGMGCSLLAA